MGSFRWMTRVVFGAAALLVLAGCGNFTSVPSEPQVTLQAKFGVLDEDHPHVGLIILDVGGVPAWRCTGTLLSPTVMLTAGHCTFGATGGRVWFQSSLVDDRQGYPFPGPGSVELAEIHTHPDYVDAAFVLYDVGVVILSEPVQRDVYGTLPDVGYFDRFASRRGQQDRSFTVVGYGLQSVVPDRQADLERRRATVQLLDVRGTAGIPTGTSVMFTNNPGRGNGSGGTCFGDSGGPIFPQGTNVVAAVTSFGLNLNCVGTSGGYRIDKEADLTFIHHFLP